MKKGVCCTFVMLMVGVFLSQNLKAQVGITAVPFLQINGDAASTGLAGADVSKIGKNGVHLNPAAIGFANTFQLSTPINFDKDYPLLTTPIKDFDWYSGRFQVIMGFEKLKVAIHYKMLNLGEQQVTGEESPDVLYTFNSRETSFGVTFAYPISDYVSIGAGINQINSDMGSGVVVGEQEIHEGKSASLDLGIQAQKTYHFDRLSFTPSLGWSLTDFGQRIRYTSNPQKDPLPMTMRGGVGFKIDVNEYLWDLRWLSFTGYAALSKIMARWEEKVVDDGNGNTQTVVTGIKPLKAIFRSWDTFSYFNGQEQVELDVWDQFMKHVGFEATVLEIVSFRFGHYFEQPKSVNREYDTVGFGLKYKYLSFDYTKVRMVDEFMFSLEGTEIYEFTLLLPIDTLFRNKGQ